MPTILIVGGYGNTGYRVAELLPKHADAAKPGIQSYVSEGS
jgi:N-acetyl-gamma-glutamylphosphate reductase